MDLNLLISMIANIARQHGLVLPPYQIPSQHFNSDLSHVHHSPTFDKGNLSPYPSSVDHSIHSQYNSSIINDLTIEIKELKNTLLDKLSSQEKVIFFAMCPSFSSSHISPYNSIHGPHNASDIKTLTKKMEEMKNCLSYLKGISSHVPSNPNPPCNPPYYEPNPNPLSIIPPPQNPNPIMTLSSSPPTTSSPSPPTTSSPKPPTMSSPPRQGYFTSLLARLKIQHNVSQSPKATPPVPSQDLPSKHDVSPLDLSISPSHHSTIPQDSSIPLSPSSDSPPNQDQDITPTTHITDSIPSSALPSIDIPLHEKVSSTPFTNTPPCQDPIILSPDSISSTPTYDDPLTMLYDLLSPHDSIPSTSSYDSSPFHDPLLELYDILSCQDQSTPSHSSTPSIPSHELIPSHNPLVPLNDPLPSQDQYTPASTFHDPSPSHDPIIPHDSPHNPTPSHDPIMPIQSPHEPYTPRLASCVENSKYPL